MERNSMRPELLVALAFPWAAFALVIGCGAAAARDGGRGGEPTQTLTLAAYTTPREAFGRGILPAFAREWQVREQRRVAFEESYVGSGAQARAVAAGLEADVVALSLEPDVEHLVQAGLITHAWRERAAGGMVSRSVVVIGVRPGNPRGIRGWDDLTRPGVKVLTPSPRTSGGAMWNVAAIFGAAWLGHTAAPAGDSLAAENLLRDVLANVVIMDKGARESLLTFEQGVGDAVVTYENEVLAARDAGQPMDYVIPDGTLLIENPVAVVDGYADRNGTRVLADAFVDFLLTPGSQRKFAEHGFRPVSDAIAAEYRGRFPPVTNLFTVRDLGGWPALIRQLFDDGAVFPRASARTAAAAL